MSKVHWEVHEDLGVDLLEALYVRDALGLRGAGPLGTDPALVPRVDATVPRRQVDGYLAGAWRAWFDALLRGEQASPRDRRLREALESMAAVSQSWRDLQKASSISQAFGGGRRRLMTELIGPMMDEVDLPPSGVVLRVSCLPLETDWWSISEARTALSITVRSDREKLRAALELVLRRYRKR